MPLVAHPFSSFLSGPATKKITFCGFPKVGPKSTLQKYIQLFFKIKERILFSAIRVSNGFTKMLNMNGTYNAKAGIGGNPSFIACNPYLPCSEAEKL